MSYSEDTIDFLHKGDLIGMHNALSNALKHDNEEMLADLAEYLQMMGLLMRAIRSMIRFWATILKVPTI